MPTRWITDLNRGDEFKIPDHAHCPASGEWVIFESIDRLDPDDEWLTFVCILDEGDAAIPGRIHDSDIRVECKSSGSNQSRSDPDFPPGQYEIACPDCGTFPLTVNREACAACESSLEPENFDRELVAINCPACSCPLGTPDEDQKIRCIACDEVQPEFKQDHATNREKY